VKRVTKLSRVLYSNHGEYDKLLINKPTKGNCIDFEVIKELDHYLTAIKQSSKSKYLILSGAGENFFCTGGDLHTILSYKDDRDKLEEYSFMMCEVLYKLLTLPKQTIAYLNGYTLGGGCELASACDIRIAKSTAKIGFIQGKLGVPTSWGGGTILKEKLQYDKWFTLLTEANIYSAFQAQKIGFVQELIKGKKVDEIEQYLSRSKEVSFEVTSTYKQIAIEQWEQSALFDRMKKEVSNALPHWFSESHLKNIENFIKK
jgi:enoyl-CoA hydratase/carnithine racemase